MADVTYIRSHSRAALATAVVLLASCDLGNNWESVTIPMQPPAEHVAILGGTVTDFTTGLPVGGVLVQVGSVDASPYSATSAADGTYEVREIRMTIATLTTSKPGYETASTHLPLLAGYNARQIRIRMSVTTTAP